MSRIGKTKWLVFIALAEYRHSELMHSLPGVLEDVDRLDYALHRYADCAIAETFPLYNHNATRDKILATFADVSERALESDQVVVYFGGHGHQKRGGDNPLPGDGMTRYLMPYEATWETTQTSGISTAKLAEALAPALLR